MVASDETGAGVACATASGDTLSGAGVDTDVDTDVDVASRYGRWDLATAAVVPLQPAPQ